MATLSRCYGVQTIFKCVSCKVALDALPLATSVLDLAKAGANDPELLRTHPEILDARAEFGATPNLFDQGTEQRPSWKNSDRGPQGQEDQERPAKPVDGETIGLD